MTRRYIAELTGNVNDDAFYLSAGTGIKLSNVAPLVWSALAAATVTVGGNPKAAIGPIGLLRVDDFCNLIGGPSHLMGVGNPDTATTTIPDFLWLQNALRMFLRGAIIGQEVDDPFNVTLRRVGPAGGYPWACSDVILITGTTANGSDVITGVPSGLITTLMAEPLGGVGGTITATTITKGTTIESVDPIGHTITMSAPAIGALETGQVIILNAFIGNNTLVTAVPSGATTGQFNTQFFKAPYSGGTGNETTPGAVAATIGAGISLRTTELCRDPTGNGDSAGGSQLRVATSRNGRNSIDQTALFDQDGSTLLGRGGVIRGSIGQTLQVGADVGQNQTHILMAGSGSSGVTGFTGAIQNGQSVITVRGPMPTTMSVGDKVSDTSITPSLSGVGTVSAIGTATITITGAHGLADAHNVDFTVLPATFTGLWGLIFYLDPPVDGYCAASPSAVTIPAHATTTDVATALGTLQTGTITVQCTFPGPGVKGPFTILNPAGPIPKIGATVVGTAIPALATISGVAGGNPADPTPTTFWISANTLNNSTGSSVTISSWNLGLTGSEIAITGGPLHVAPITITYQGSYHSSHHYYALGIVNTSMTVGAVKCVSDLVGIPATLGDASFDGPVYRAGVELMSNAWVPEPVPGNAASQITSAQAGGFYVFGVGGVVALAANGSAAAYFHLDPADFPISMLMRLRATIICNSVAPTINFTFGLYPVATWGGGSNADPTIATVGAATISIPINTPSPSVPTRADSATVSYPAAGDYVLGVTLSGATAANSIERIAVRLQRQQT